MIESEPGPDAFSVISFVNVICIMAIALPESIRLDIEAAIRQGESLLPAIHSATKKHITSPPSQKESIGEPIGQPITTSNVLPFPKKL